MGKGDKKTKRGKIRNKSYGVRRRRKAKKLTAKSTKKVTTKSTKKKQS